MAEIPGLGVATSAITHIIKVVETIRIHKEQCIHLRDRAVMLWNSLEESMKSDTDNDEIRRAVSEMGQILIRINKRMTDWASLGRVKSFIKQADITRELDMLEKDLDMAGLRFSITTMLEVNRSHNQFRMSQARDNAQLSDLIRTIMTNRDDLATITELRAKEPEVVESIMESVQNELHVDPGSSKEGQQEQQALQAGLTELRQRTGILPPLANLTGEVKKLGDFPVARGHFADIWRGEWLGETVALKNLRNVGQLDAATEKKFDKEVTIWRQLQHPHVAKLYGICFFGPFVHMVSPWAHNEDAFKYLLANREADRVKLLAEAAEGLAYLHAQSPPIIHGDFRAANILISESGEALISDFGMSRLEEFSDVQGSMSLNSTGAARWMAPELVNPERFGRAIPKPTTATDVWSFGIVCYESFSLEKPYAHRALDVQVIKDIELGFRHKRPRGTAETQGLTDAIWRLMEDCWNDEPLDRPTMSHVSGRLKMLHSNRKLRQATLGISVPAPTTNAQIATTPVTPRGPARSSTGSTFSRNIPTPIQEVEHYEEDYSLWLKGTMEGLGRLEGVSLPDPSSSEPLFSSESAIRARNIPQRNGTSDLPPSPPISPPFHEPSSFPDSVSTLESGISNMHMNASTSHTGHPYTVPPSPTSRRARSIGGIKIPSTLSRVPEKLKRSETMNSKDSFGSSGSSNRFGQPPTSPVVGLPANIVELKNDGSTVVAGTLEGLIYRMVITGSLESRQFSAPFREAFLTMYIAFTDANTVLDVLIDQYDDSCRTSSLTIGQRIDIRFNVLDIIEQWIRQHRVEETDVLLLERMKEFVSSIRDPPAIVTKAQKLITDVIDPGLDTIQSGSAYAPSIYPMSMHSVGEAKLSQVTHESLAKHFTIIESRLYMAMRATDIVAWLRRVDGEASRAVINYQLSQQRLTAWVQKVILKVKGGAQDRADKYVYFIMAAYSCYTMGNFSSMSAIVLALQSMVIGRLRQTREHVEKKYMKQLNEMASLLDVTHNYNNYRRAVALNKAPIVPCLHVHLRDISNTYTRYSSTIQGKKADLINFRRYEKTLSEIRTALRFQSQAYQDLEPEMPILNLIQRQLGAITPGPDLDNWMEMTSQERLNQEGPTYMSKDEALRMTGFA